MRYSGIGGYRAKNRAILARSNEECRHENHQRHAGAQPPPREAAGMGTYDVAELEAERTLVESNRKLIEVFEKKIQEKLAEIWCKAKKSQYNGEKYGA